MAAMTSVFTGRTWTLVEVVTRSPSLVPLSRSRAMASYGTRTSSSSSTWSPSSYMSLMKSSLKVDHGGREVGTGAAGQVGDDRVKVCPVWDEAGQVDGGRTRSTLIEQVGPGRGRVGEGRSGRAGPAQVGVVDLREWCGGSTTGRRRTPGLLRATPPESIRLRLACDWASTVTVPCRPP
jgi:hypothetical protein